MNKITVALVEDLPDIRQAFSILLQNVGDFHFLGAFPTCEEARKKIPQIKPQVLLMDINLPDGSGIDTVYHLKNKMPEMEIIMLTILSDDDSIFQSLQAGASGYLNKDISSDKLFEAIREVRKGHSPMSGLIARRVVQHFKSLKKTEDYGLTNTEKRILDSLCTGKSYKAIGESLFVSINTVKFHLKNIYSKLQVSTRAEAILKVKKW